MTDLVFGLFWVLVPVAVMIFWLFRQVKKRRHPSRSVWISFLTVLGFLIVVPLVVGGASLVLPALLGRVGVWAAIGAIFGSIAAGWDLSRKWIEKPKRGYIEAAKP